MKTSRIILLIMAAAMILPSCGKYEEGPGLSFRSKKERLSNLWTVETVLSNAVDITTDYKESHRDYTMEFTEDGTFKESYKDALGTVHTNSGDWEFGSKKETVEMTYAPPAGVTLSFEILKLKEKELWLKITFTTGAVSSINEYHYIPE